MFMKTEPLNVKVLPEHKQALRALARLEGEPMSVVLRRMIKKVAQQEGVWPPMDINEFYMEREGETGASNVK